jgi:hypothetical protein
MNIPYILRSFPRPCNIASVTTTLFRRLDSTFSELRHACLVAPKRLTVPARRVEGLRLMSGIANRFFISASLYAATLVIFADTGLSTTLVTHIYDGPAERAFQAARIVRAVMTRLRITYNLMWRRRRSRRLWLYTYWSWWSDWYGRYPGVFRSYLGVRGRRE